MPDSEIRYNQPVSQPISLSGIFAAAITPLGSDFTPDLEAIPRFLQFLSQRGCHGALLLGTTGEGPSFSTAERLEIFRVARSIHQVSPDFRLLGGTGTPSLEETIYLTHAAFELGLDGVVVLPPYYFRKVSDEGLFAWFSQVIRESVPEGGAFLGYHIPPITGVPLSLNLLARLKDAFPDRFAGIKDSSGDPEHARQLGQRFGKDLQVFTGNDRLFSLALQSQASGCITAMVNLFSPISRQVWESFLTGEPSEGTQQQLNGFRTVMERYPPAPALVKALLHRMHSFNLWSVRPPLEALPIELTDQAEAEILALLPKNVRG